MLRRFTFAATVSVLVAGCGLAMGGLEPVDSVTPPAQEASAGSKGDAAGRGAEAGHDAPGEGGIDAGSTTGIEANEDDAGDPGGGAESNADDGGAYTGSGSSGDPNGDRM